MNDIASQIDEVWSNLRAGDRFRTPDRTRGVDFVISTVASDRIHIKPQGVSITRAAFEAAMTYLIQSKCYADKKCDIGSNNDRNKAGPLCQSSRDANSNVRCINYIVPILKRQGLVEFSGDRPNKVWLP